MYTYTYTYIRVQGLGTVATARMSELADPDCGWRFVGLRSIISLCLCYMMISYMYIYIYIVLS